MIRTKTQSIYNNVVFFIYENDSIYSEYNLSPHFLLMI
jgi:hypothetical protein